MRDETYVHALQRRLHEQQQEVDALMAQLGQAPRDPASATADELSRVREQLFHYARDYAASVAKYISLETKLRERAAELAAQEGARQTALDVATRRRRALLDMLTARWPSAARELAAAQRVASALGVCLGWDGSHTDDVRVMLEYAMIGRLGLPDGVAPHSPGADAIVALFAERLADSGGPDDHWGAALRHHRERYDGCGAPDGLRGYQIPLESRVIRLALGVAAMVAEEIMPDVSVVRRELARGAGRVYDPALVNLVLTFDDIVPS